MALCKSTRIHQYLEDWLVRARSHDICLQHTKELIETCLKLGWMVNFEKSELDPKQILDFVDYQFNLKCGKVQPTPDQWQKLQQKILALLSRPGLSGLLFISLIGLLTEKQVYLGRLHEPNTVASQNWRVPESLEKVILIPKFLYLHLKWWLEESNASRSTIKPTRTCSANLYRCIKRRVGHSFK